MSRLTQQGVKDRDNASPLLALLYTMALGLTSLPQVKHHLEQVLNLKMLTMEEEVLCGGGGALPGNILEFLQYSFGVVGRIRSLTGVGEGFARSAQGTHVGWAGGNLDHWIIVQEATCCVHARGIPTSFRCLHSNNPLCAASSCNCSHVCRVTALMCALAL